MNDLRDAFRRTQRWAPPPDDAFQRLVDRRDRKRRNSRLASAALGLVVAAAAIGGAALAFGHGPARSVVGGTPAANGGPNLQAGPGQYYYWKTVRPMSEGGNVVEEVWWGEDGSGRYKADSTNPAYGVMKDQSWGPGGSPGVFPFETDLSGLSDDPSVLLGQLEQRSSTSGASPAPDVTLAPGLSPTTSQLWRAIQDIVEMGNATPSLRSALFEVASGLPGVEERTGVTDPVGRPATALSVTLGDYYCGGPDVMWFDPQTHLLLASDGDLGCGPSVIIVAGGIVGSTSDMVAPGDGYVPAPVTSPPSPSSDAPAKSGGQPSAIRSPAATSR